MTAESALRFGIVVSTAGSVMNEVLKNEFFRSRVQLVVVDRHGPAYEKALDHGLPAKVVSEPHADRFCDELLALFRAYAIDYVFSFYTEFFSADFRKEFEDRILNFHPSLLPSFKGADGFGDTLAYHSRFAGNTVELIADVMDEGKIVMQTVCAVDTGVPAEMTRHTVFVHQCRALLQSARWLQEGRITVDGHQVTVAGARFDDGPFSPALDCPEVMAWEPPDPFADLR